MTTTVIRQHKILMFGYNSKAEAEARLRAIFGSEQIAIKDCRVLEKASLREGKPLRDHLSEFWDGPVHADERQTNFRQIQADMLRWEREMKMLLTGGLRVKVSRELAAYAVNQLARGKRAHALTFAASPHIDKAVAPKIKEIYSGAQAEAKREGQRIIEQKRVTLEETPQEVLAKKHAQEQAALLAAVNSAEDNITNFFSAAVHSIVTDDPTISEMATAGQMADAETELEAALNDYSDKQLESVANKLVRNTVRMGRADGFGEQPDLDDAEWMRSALLDSHTCGPCEALDLTPIDGPDEDLSEACEGGDMCRCLPIAVLEGSIAR